VKAGLTYRYPQRAESYAQALRQAGVEPALIAPGGPRSIEGLDGLLISGGSDVDPAMYGEARRPEVTDVDSERDRMEAELIRQALAADLPLFGICRGMQLMNVACGGTLIQHLPTAVTHRVQQVANAHAIVAAAGTKLASIIGTDRKLVNSRHHQAVDRLGRGLVESAIAPDGVLEGLEHPDKRFAIAVQWHPEDRLAVGEHDRALFAAFASALGRRGK
jgi:putative glutamine amidotransferase